LVGNGAIKFENKTLIIYKQQLPAGEFFLQNGELKFKTKSLIQPMPKKFYRSKPDLMKFPQGAPADFNEPIKSTMELMDKIAESPDDIANNNNNNNKHDSSSDS